MAITNRGLVSYPIYVRMLALLFAKLSTIIDLSISFKNASAVFFKQLTKAFPIMHLRCLKLSHAITRYKCLRMFIQISSPALEHLTLEYLDLTRLDDFEPLCFVLAQMDLNECVLRKINAGDKGIRFGALNRTRPMFSGEGIVPGNASFMQFELSVLSGDDESVSELWNDAATYCESGPAWPRSA